MSLTWKDGVATVFVGAAVVLYLLSQGEATVAGPSGPRALTIAILALGVGGCYSARSQMATIRHATSHSVPEVIHPAR